MKTEDWESVSNSVQALDEDDLRSLIAALSIYVTKKQMEMSIQMALKTRVDYREVDSD